MQEYFIRSRRTEQYLTCVRSMDSGNGPCWKCSELCHMLLIAFALPPSPRVRVPSSNGDDENRCQSGQTRLHFNIFTLLCNRLFVEQNDTGVAGSIQLSADGTGNQICPKSREYLLEAPAFRAAREPDKAHTVIHNTDMTMLQGKCRYCCCMTVRGRHERVLFHIRRKRACKHTSYSHDDVSKTQDQHNRKQQQQQ